MKKISVLLFALVLTACASAPRIAAPNLITAPTPIVGNSGKYMSPYTEDGTVAAWVEKGRNASAGASIGGFLGAQAGQKVAENIPFIGGFTDWLPIPYHFNFIRGDRVIGTHTRQSFKFRDTYTIDMTADEGRTLDRRLVLATAVGLDALQAR